MTWSLPIGRLFGIPVRIHLTLIILLAMIGLWVASDGRGLSGFVGVIVVAALIFGSVLLHELGHALTARRFGVRTREIVLLPIGGAAMLAEEPKRPSHDLAISLAGPAVSLALAAVSWALTLVTEGTLFVWIAWLNLILGLFNLIPAFPLDGGRALRAGLTHWMGRVRATRAAARIGRFFAIGFVVLAFVYEDVLLGFIGAFVLIAASAEERNVIIQDIIGSRTVRDVMQPLGQILGAASSLDAAAATLEDRPELRALLVTFGDRALGVVHREPLLAAARAGQAPPASEAAPPAPPTLHELIDRNVVSIAPDVPLKELLTRMGKERSRAAVVVDDVGGVSGLVHIEGIVEEIRAARDREF